jgi:uncharacterized protein (DUF1800 family)
MKIKSIHRRQLLAGGVASTLLAALPLASQTAQSKSTPRRSTKIKQNPLVASIKAAQLPQQTFAHMVYSRLGFGITPGEFDQASWAALPGGTDAAKLTNFVNQQLAGGNDVDVNARIQAAGNFNTLNLSLNDLWVDYRIDANNQTSSYRPIYEMKRLKFTRAVYSLFPLRERIADFWHDHFSLNGDDLYARSTMTSWDRDVIRNYMLGNFKDFLVATAKHPAMLYYLDNYNNSLSEPNENYAREMIELHTMGVENYYGLANQGEVPTITVNESGNAWPSGPGPGESTIQQFYVDSDVYEAGRCLTGWRVNDYDSAGNTGEFQFDSSRHDRNQKAVLAAGSVNFFADQGILDGEYLMEMLAYHPGTAKHIAGKLARFFITDDPPQSVIDDVADVFYNNRTASNQLELVFKALFNHPDFADPIYWQSKLKRPFDTVVSAMRACETDFTIRPDHNDSNTFESRMDDTGHFPFEWQAPDGFPIQSNFWMSSTALIQTWKTVDWIMDETESDENITPLRVNTLAHFQNIQDQLTPQNLVAFWMTRIFNLTPPGGWLGDPVFEAAVTFLRQSPSQGSFPRWPADKSFPYADLQSNSYPYYWHERLRGTVSLILASPYFMQR